MAGNRDHEPLQRRIDAVLARIIKGSSPPPAWYEAWSRLGPDSSELERLAVYQAVRDAGSIPREAGFYLVSWQIDVLTLDEAEGALRELEDRLEAIRRAHGLQDDESWPPGEGPPEYEETLRSMHDAWDRLHAARLEACGEIEMARLFRSDPERYEQLNEIGRAFFHGEQARAEATVEWLDRLLEGVSACVEAESPMGPLELRYLEDEEDDFCEVWVYPTPVELLGGAHDGEVVVPGFSLDLEQLRALCDSVAAFAWDALGLNDPEGSQVSLEGIYRGRELFLHVLAQAPADAEPGMKLDTTRRPQPPE